MTKEELNAQLLDVCLADEVDYARAEELLRLGAEPLGRIEHSWSSPSVLYDEVVEWFCDEDNSSEDFYKITELFLRYGMNIAKPAVPYGDFDNDIVENPMWTFTFLLWLSEPQSDYVLDALKLLLDHGLSADDAAVFWTHAATDIWIAGVGFRKEYGSDEGICAYARALLLIASYPHILNEDEHLRREIWYDSNHYDLMRFRNWNDFYFTTEIYPCDVYSDTYCSVVTVTEKATEKMAWQFGVELHN